MASKLRRASRALSIKSSKSGKSEYDYDSQFGNDDLDNDDDASVSSPVSDVYTPSPPAAFSFSPTLIWPLSRQANDSDGFDDLGRRPSAMSDSSAFSVESYLSSATRAMSKLQDHHSASDSSWKKALTHKKSGTQVYVSKEKSYVSAGKGNKGFYAPVFKSVLDVDGFAPAAVFGVVGTRKLWDEWSVSSSLTGGKPQGSD